MAYNKIFIDLHILWALCILWELESLGGMPGKKPGWPGGTANQKKRPTKYNERRQNGIYYPERDLKCTGPIKFTGP